jgi:multicomponent Na+:H+ antiporter subunit E
MKTTEPRTNLIRISAIALGRLFWCALLWWILTEGEWGDWSIALVSLGLATAATLWLWPTGAWNWRHTGWLSFAPFFLVESVRGGLDVAQRALRPAMPLRPKIVNYQFRRLTGPGMVFFVWVVSLLPGTAAVLLEEKSLRIHVLDHTQPIEEKLEELEHRIRGLFVDGSQ